VTREGQKVDIYTAVWTFTGKRGSLVFGERNEWVDIGNDANRDGNDDGVAVGTWKVVGGTGQYAKLAGGGWSGHEGSVAPGSYATRASSPFRSALTDGQRARAPPVSTARSKQLLHV
jgi:hypothetical protein